MKEQQYFERDMTWNSEESEKQFYNLLDKGWKIVIAIPVQSGMSCYTYTGAIHYVLEKEE